MSKTYAGHLFAVKEPAETPKHVFRSSAVKWRRTVVRSSSWYYADFESDVPLLNELGTDNPSLLQMSYTYPVYARLSESGQLFLIAQSRGIVDHLLEKERLARTRRPIEKRGLPVHRVRVSVHRLVVSLLKDPIALSLTRVDANIPVGDALRFVTFHGEDIGSSSTFRKISSALRFYACGLKSRGQDVEQLHVNTHGHVRCLSPDADVRNAVDTILDFLATRGYLKTDREVVEA